MPCQAKWPAKGMFTMRVETIKKKVTVADRQSAYQAKESITALLPWKEYSEEANCFLLSDGKSLGTCLELSMIPVESKSVNYLEKLVQQIGEAIKACIPQINDNPYIVSCYLQDEANLDDYYNLIKAQIKPELKNNPFTQKHLEIMRSHFDFLTQDNGAFYDSVVTGTNFQGKVRKLRLVIHRWIRDTKHKSRQELTPLEELQKIARDLSTYFNNTRLMNGSDFYAWMVKWFNPSPKNFNGDNAQLLKACPYPEGELPYGWDLAEQVFFNAPESEEPYWLFDDKYHSVVGLQALQRSPRAGELSAELKQLDYTYALMDKLPNGSILNLTFVCKSDDETKQHLKRVEESARGRKPLAVAMREQAIQAEDALARGKKIYPAMINVFLRGDSREAIAMHEEQVSALFNRHGLKIININHELVPLHNYLTFLPMNYDYHFDTKNLYRSRYMYLEDISKLMPIYGRERGTEHPNLVFFNHGGEPISHDPMKDMASTSHCFIVSDTGSGKSNLMASIISSTIALHNPYFVILEAGGSFDLLGEFYQDYGKSINHVDFQDDISLNPFSEAIKALELFEQSELDEEKILQQTIENLDATLDDLNNNKEVMENDKRDYFSEMALALRLMVTGGNPKEEERFTRSDSMLLMDALMQAAKTVREAGRPQVIISDVLKAIDLMIESNTKASDADMIKRLREMHNNIRYFTRDYTAKRFFNRPGNPWPTKDITLVNLQKFVGSGEEKALYMALAVIGCLNKVMAFTEENQSKGRNTILVIDEAHILTKNPIISAILVLVAKMARKFGLWLWIATQHVKDFSNEATKILSMLETWICLVMGGQEQINDIKRFKTLTPEQEKLLQEAKKEDGVYSEGVLLGAKLTALFRNVPPREYLSLAMTNPSQKHQRQVIMQKEGVSEQEAALIMANNMKKTSGDKR